MQETCASRPIWSFRVKNPLFSPCFLPGCLAATDRGRHRDNLQRSDVQRTAARNRHGAGLACVYLAAKERAQLKIAVIRFSSYKTHHKIGSPRSVCGIHLRTIVNPKKKVSASFRIPRIFFEPMFTRACYVFGISYPEKIGVSVTNVIMLIVESVTMSCGNCSKCSFWTRI